MRDIKYIIKRIIIGIGIATAMMFIRQNVYAYEWETEGDEQITYSYYKGTRYFFTSSVPNRPSSVSYPKTLDSSSATVGNYTTTDTTASGTPSGFIYGNYACIGPYYDYGDIFDFTGIEFTPNNNYYVIIPYAYNNDTFTSVSSNVNENLVLDPTTYTSNSNFTTITSASLVFGVTNDLENNSSYPYYYYWKISFIVSDTVNDLIFYIGDPTAKTITYSAFNTTTFNNYLLKSKLLKDTYASSGVCSYRPEHYYKPFVYSHVAGSIFPIEDGNTVASDVSSDIKTQIDEIVNGQFTADLELPYLNGGGRPFGQQNDYSLQDLLILPLNFIQQLSTSEVCTPVTLPLPGLNGNMEMPCLSSFATSIVGEQIVDLVKLIIGCILGFRILTALYNSVIHIFDPQHLLYVDDIF